MLCTSRYVKIADNSHFALDLRRVAQQRRYQHPSLAIDLHQLAVIVGAVQKLFLRRIEDWRAASFSSIRCHSSNGYTWATFPSSEVI